MPVTKRRVITFPRPRNVLHARVGSFSALDRFHAAVLSVS